MSSRNAAGFLIVSVIVAVLITGLVKVLPVAGDFNEETAAEPSGQPLQYIHNWDDNPVAYIPETTTVDMSLFSKEIPTVEIVRQYSHNWDDNPVATIPESTMSK